MRATYGSGVLATASPTNPGRKPRPYGLNHDHKNQDTGAVVVYVGFPGGTAL